MTEEATGEVSGLALLVPLAWIAGLAWLVYVIEPNWIGWLVYLFVFFLIFPSYWKRREASGGSSFLKARVLIAVFFTVLALAVASSRGFLPRGHADAMEAVAALLKIQIARISGV